jgi:hypothetical protein
MKHSIVFLVIFTLLTNCENENNGSSTLLDFIPENSLVIVKSKSIENLATAINSNTLLSEALNYKSLKALNEQLQILKHLKTNNEFLICFTKNTKKDLDFTFITKVREGLFDIDSIPNLISESFQSKKLSITKTTVDDLVLFNTIKDSVFIASNALSIIETISSKKAMDSELKTLFKTSSKEKSLSLILNLKEQQIKPLFFNEEALNKMPFSNYLMIDIDIAQNNIVFNGITKATDSMHSLINVFKNTTPQENKMSSITPIDANYMLSYSYNNFNTLNQNIQKLGVRDTLISSPILNNSIEVGVIQIDNQQAIVLHSIDASLTQENLESPELIESFRDINIYPFQNAKVFKHVLYPLLNYETASFYAVVDDFFVFSDKVDFLKVIISNYLNKTTLSESTYYKNLMLDMSDASSIFIFNNADNLNSNLNGNFNEALNLKIDSYKASALQFIYDTDFAHVNGVLKTYKSRGLTNSVSEDINISLDAELLSAPQIISNHTNNQKDIVVQDVNNNLYLISNQGKIFWKKQLEGKVLGQIEQIDIYKNGRLQLVFATQHRVYVLDRNGNNVSPFPLKFNDNITQPLSVFDYDNNKNYRLLVTQGKSLLMYDKAGKSVKGFNYKKETPDITSQPKHFRIGNKDYIVFSQGKSMKILDRVGNSRVKSKENISFSNNGIFLYNNRFTTTTSKGDLIQIDQNGKSFSTNLNLDEKHFITCTSKTLVTLSENHLTIKSNSIDLDYGDYTAPEIFYINNKIYVTTTDLQAKKIYIFDSLGKPIANFPIYGNSAIALGNIDKDQNIEVVTKGDDKSIIIYKIN